MLFHLRSQSRCPWLRLTADLPTPAAMAASTEEWMAALAAQTAAVAGEPVVAPVLAGEPVREVALVLAVVAASALGALAAAGAPEAAVPRPGAALNRRRAAVRVGRST